MDRVELLTHARKINQDFTDLLLRNGNLNDLVQMVAKRLERSVCIEDPAHYIVADAKAGEVDLAREQCVQFGRTSAQHTRQLIEHGVYHRARRSLKPLFIEPLPIIGVTLGRIVSPILINDDVHGLMWIIADRAISHPLERELINQATTAAALILLRENAARDVRNALSSDFFANLLREPQDLSQLKRQARRLDYQLHRPRQALVVYGVPTDPASQQSFGTAVDNWLLEHNHHALKAWRGDHLVMMVACDTTTNGAKIAHQLYEYLAHPQWLLQIGVGQAYADASPQNVRQSYQEALEATEIAAKQSNLAGVQAFDELGLLHWLYQLTPQQHNNNRYIKYINALKSHDQAHRTDLVTTLFSYCTNDFSLTLTAQKLHVHRNTLVKRLNRIEQLCGLELRNSAEILNLYIALLSSQLHDP
ncbi:MAG: PucR family transcriptional regulator [Candidatus Promineifilaceae bacterium]